MESKPPSGFIEEERAISTASQELHKFPNAAKEEPCLSKAPTHTTPKIVSSLPEHIEEEKENMTCACLKEGGKE